MPYSFCYILFTFHVSVYIYLFLLLFLRSFCLLLILLSLVCFFLHSFVKNFIGIMPEITWQLLIDIIVGWTWNVECIISVCSRIDLRCRNLGTNKNEGKKTSTYSKNTRRTNIGKDLVVNSTIWKRIKVQDILEREVVFKWNRAGHTACVLDNTWTRTTIQWRRPSIKWHYDVHKHASI